jgi:DNA-binding transcriptional LysR family regulator
MLLPPLIECLERDAPNVNLRIVPLTTRDPRALIEAGDIDVAIGYFPAAVASIGLAAMQSGAPDAFAHSQLYSGEYVCVMRRGHPLAKRRKAPTVSVDQYCGAKHLLVSFSGRPYGFIDEALASMGRTRRIVLTVNQFFTAGRVVANSDLLTVLPRHFLSATGIRDEFAVAELPFDVPQVHVDMVWHRRSQANSAQQWLRGAIQSAAKNQFLQSPTT